MPRTSPKDDTHHTPLPVDETTAAALARHFRDGIEAGSSREAAVAKAITKAIHALLALPPDASPSERKRLRRALGLVHTRAELERLMGAAAESRQRFRT